MGVETLQHCPKSWSGTSFIIYRFIFATHSPVEVRAYKCAYARVQSI